MIARMVHWRDTVGKEFLEEFTRITRALVLAAREQRDAETVLARLTEDVRARYQTARRLMRFSGYQEIGDHVVRWHGWYKAYLDRDELRFLTTAPPDRIYITPAEFLGYKSEKSLLAEEDYYYGLKSDPDFVPERNGGHP